MKAIRIILPLYMGFLLSSLLVFFLGNGGLDEYNRLLAIRQKLTENVAELNHINNRLNQQITALSTDAETIRLEARKMGYYPQGVQRIRIEGYTMKEDSYAVGKLIQRTEIQMRKGSMFRVFGFAIPACLYIFAFFQWIVKRRK